MLLLIKFAIMQEFDVFGRAIADYHKGKKKATILVHSDGLDQQVIKCKQLFRSKNELPALEKEALKHCKGKILDIGAGAGCHSLILQDEGADIVAVELSKEASEIMLKRGIKQVKNLDIFKFKGEHFDTLLLLMNGLGIAGTLSGLARFLDHLKQLLNPDGVIIAESSDLLFFADDEEIDDALNSEHYYGEIDYQLEYQGNMGIPFKWLFVDFLTLKDMAKRAGYETTLLYEDHEGGYLVKLSLF